MVRSCAIAVACSVPDGMVSRCAPGTDQPREGLVDRVRALVPLIAEAAARGRGAAPPARPRDRGAAGPPACSGRSCPRRYGGYEIDFQTFVDIGLAVARADPSTGWITTFYMEHNWLLTMFADELQDEVFGAQPYVLAPGSVNPTGLAVPLPDGGYRLSGHWTSAPASATPTGCCSAGGSTATTPGASRNFLVPVDQVEVKDTWHVDGMAATGSRDIVATDVVVPERRVSLAIPPFLTAGPDAGLPRAHPGAADAVAHRGDAGRRRRAARARAVRGAARAARHVRHHAHPERPGPDPGAPGQPRRRGRRHRGAAAGRRRPDAGPRRGPHLARPARPAPAAARDRPHRPPLPRRRARGPRSRAGRRCTTSTTSCSASTATST